MFKDYQIKNNIQTVTKSVRIIRRTFRQTLQVVTIVLLQANCRVFFQKKLFYYQNRFLNNEYILQGDPNQNCPFLRAITQNVSTSDPLLVKPKCV